MRKKEMKVVVTFRTTADAMAMEEACKKAGAPGRMIPVPRMITAGCGLAWAADPEDKKALEKLLADTGIEAQSVQLCVI